MKSKKILILCCGIPRCGKTSWAITTGWPIISPDCLRTIIHGTPFRQEVEPLVWAMAKIMVGALFEAGHPVVILDATNTTRHRRSEWKDDRWEIKYKCFDTPKAVCIERALLNKQDYLVPVIERMAKQIEFPTENLLLSEEELNLRLDLVDIALTNASYAVDDAHG